MSSHSGSCRLLIRAFDDLIPSKGNTIFKDPHVSGDDDVCFRKTVSDLVNQATIETRLSVEYAIICQQIAEIFEPAPGEEKTCNQFKYALTNQLQKNFVSFRQNLNNYKNHDDHVKLQEEIEFEEDFATRTRLRKEMEARQNSRLKAIGTVKLIAELFNVELINGRVMDLCMRDLLCGSQEPSELDIECFHSLMTIIGAKLESNPVGKKVIEKFLCRLDEIIHNDSIKYCTRIRFLMLEIFQLRANNWKTQASLKEAIKHPKPVKVTVKKAPVENKLLKEIKASRILFQELNNVLYFLGPDELVRFVDQFREIKFQSEDQLEGAIKIIFERVMSASNMLSLFALVCKGLADVTAPAVGNKDRVTFKELFLSLIRHEIEKQRQNSPTFRQISEKTKTLQTQRNAKRAQQLKAEVENDFKVQARSHRFTVFVGELYNAGMVESFFIFEYILRLLDLSTISSTSVECFYFLIQTVDRKLLQGRDNTDLLKHSLSNLCEAMKIFTFSHRTQFMVKDLLDKCRNQLGILSDAGLMGDFSGHNQCGLPWNSTLSEDILWPEKINTKLGIHTRFPAEQTNGHAENFVSFRGPPPARNSIEPLTQAQSPYHQEEKRVEQHHHSKKGNLKKASSCNNLAPVPVDSYKGRINPNMIKKKRG